MILLAIETSTPIYSVALSTPDTTIVRTTTRTDPDYDGIAGLVESVLRDAGVVPSALAGIVVDRGPGNLISVRAGLTFASGLAYAAGVPIHAANSLEILAQEAIRTDGAAFPILATRAARKQSSDLIYAGLFDAQGTRKLALGKIGDIAQEVRDSCTDLRVAGTHRDIVELQGLSVTYTGAEHPTAQALLDLMATGRLPVQTQGISPLTEESEEFRV